MTTPLPPRNPDVDHPDVDHPDNDRHEPDHNEPIHRDPDQNEPERHDPDRSEPARQDPNPDDDVLTVAERKEEPPALDAEDEAELAAMDSFPASDPPSFTPSHAGAASETPVTTHVDDAK
ncbi:hypothetical protein [Gemmatimonas sp.]|nr:hypothetical protein [Gemmatimonas sp.]